MKSIKYFYLLIVFVLSSCIGDLDFDQVNDFSATPVFTSSLVYFTLDQQVFIDPNTGMETQNEIKDEFQFDIFDDQGTRDRLQKLDIDLEIENRFDRSFTLKLTFLDRNRNTTYTGYPDLTIPVNTSNPFVAFKPATHEIDMRENPAFLDTKIIVVSLKIENSSTPLDPNVTQTLTFKSAGTYHLKF